MSVYYIYRLRGAHGVYRAHRRKPKGVSDDLVRIAMVLIISYLKIPML